MPSSGPAPVRGRTALRLSRELLRHLPSGIVFFDDAGRVEEANPAARAALGFTRPQGLSARELFRDAELREADGTLLGAAAALVEGLYGSGMTLQRKTLHYTTPEGDSRRLGLTLFPIRAEQNKRAPGVFCLLTDLTAIQALEEELQQRKRLSALGEMAAGIAHEFKNALATISGYAQMLEASLDGSGQDHARRILEQAAMLSNIATEFLTFARPMAVQPERIELERLLGDCAGAIRVQDFPQVEITIEGPFPAVRADAVLLTSAVTNLLRNACEAIVQSGQGRRVWVRVGEPQEGFICLIFGDDGPGVAPDLAEKIFIPFFTTKASGTGLGLAMVHKIITAHRGRVLLTSTGPGHTSFTVLLPGTE